MAGVARRCPAGHPAVIVTHPLVGGPGSLRPFPTLYWLTCPALCRQLSRLEMRGLIQEFDARLAADEDFAAAMAQAHEDYVAAREALVVPPVDPASARVLATMRSRGIGGIANWRSTKCLHLHFAHHLAGRNPIGAELAELHGIRPCPAAG